MEESRDYFRKDESSHGHFKRRRRHYRHFFRDIVLVGLVVFFVLLLLSLSGLFREKVGLGIKSKFLRLFERKKLQIEKEIKENKDNKGTIDSQKEFEPTLDELF